MTEENDNVVCPRAENEAELVFSLSLSLNVVLPR